MTAGNLSSAVRQQRHEAPDSLDDFPTPPWATRALLRQLRSRWGPLTDRTAWEPCCNRGHMARPLAEEFGRVHATDLRDYGWPGQDGVGDFLMDWSQDDPGADWIITNPPFRLGCEMIGAALDRARVGVAVFVRTAFVEGAARHDALFRDRPETLVLPFVERVVLWRGVLLDPDIPVTRWNARAGAYVTEKPTSATSYCWLVWHRHHAGPTEMRRIAPCRRDLTRPGDYPPLPDHLRPRQEEPML
jgi:hypothetical protein